MELLLTTLVVFGAQLCSAWHVWKCAKQIDVVWATPRVVYLMGMFAAFLAFVQLAFGITVSSLAWVYWDIREMDKHRWVAIVWLGSASICSIITAYNLSSLIGSSYMRVQSIIDLINELLRCFIHTGLLTSVLTVVNLAAFSCMGQYIRIGANFPLGTLNLITLLAVLNARSGQIIDSETIEEYECDASGRASGRKGSSHSDVNQATSQGSLRIGKLSLKIPSKLHGTGTSLKVFVQKETHVIGISGIKVEHSKSMIYQHDDADGTESTDTRADSAKPRTLAI